MSLPTTSNRCLQTLIVLCLSIILSSELNAATHAKERGSRVTGERQHTQIRNKRGPQGRQDKEIDFQYRGKNYRMVLKPVSVRSDIFKVTAIGDNGRRRTVNVAAPKLYQGYLADDPLSKASVSLSGSRIKGYVKMASGEVLGIEASHNDKNPEHSVYSVEDLEEEMLSCAAETPILSALDSDNDSAKSASPLEAASSATTLYVAEIAFEADYEYFLGNGSSISNTVADIESILNSVNTIYENDVQIRHVLTEIIIRETVASDPYTTTVASNLIVEVRNQWNNNHSSVSRDVAHLMTGRSLDGSTVGIAYSGVICSPSNASYGLSQSKSPSSFAGRVALTAHELGHNWSADHCTCNIMCSSLGGCGGSLSSFSQTSIDSIKTYRDANSSCLDLTNSPPIVLNDSFAAIPNADTNLVVLANDSDPDGNPFSITSTSTPLHGTATLNPDQTILYHSDELFTGVDEFEYVITDGVHGSSTGTVTIGVGFGINYEYYEGNFFSFPDFDTLTPDGSGTTLAFDLEKKQRDSDFAFRFQGQLDIPVTATYTFSMIAHNRASLYIDGNRRILTRFPTTEYSSSFTLTQGLHDIEVRYYHNNFDADLQLRWSSASIAKDFIAREYLFLFSPNLSPVATDDEAYTTENNPVTIQVLTNDMDPDGISVSLSSNSSPAGGSASISGSGILYTPSSNYFGTELITYTISDTQGATNSATLEILVDTDTDLDTLFNAFDPDDDNDGLSDEEEAVAGTSSTNNQSFFLAEMENGPAVTFMGVTGRLYQVQCKTNLTDLTWLDVGIESAGQGVLIQVPATNNTDAAYYRVGVRLAP